jgi:hypothetical protein
VETTLLPNPWAQYQLINPYQPDDGLSYQTIQPTERFHGAHSVLSNAATSEGNCSASTGLTTITTKSADGNRPQQSRKCSLIMRLHRFRSCAFFTQRFGTITPRRACFWSVNLKRTRNGPLSFRPSRRRRTRSNSPGRNNRCSRVNPAGARIK